MDELMYCENGECRVELYHTTDPDGTTKENCPGCGQFGRTKGK
jgi:hypothetical protein